MYYAIFLDYFKELKKIYSRLAHKKVLFHEDHSLSNKLTITLPKFHEFVFKPVFHLLCCGSQSGVCRESLLGL